MKAAKVKIVINDTYGGFGLSEAGGRRYGELKGLSAGEWKGAYFCGGEFEVHEIPRDDPALVQTVEEMGPSCYGMCASLKVVKIPADVKWHIAEYDGLEWVAEDHRTWS